MSTLRPGCTPIFLNKLFTSINVMYLLNSKIPSRKWVFDASQSWSKRLYVTSSILSNIALLASLTGQVKLRFSKVKNPVHFQILRYKIPSFIRSIPGRVFVIKISCAVLDLVLQGYSAMHTMPAATLS